MKTSDAVATATTTRPMAHTLADMISNGVSGMTSKCSIVPCSRSRISAAPVRMMDSMVMLLISSITEPNQTELRFGLKRARTSSSAGRVVTARCPCTNAATSPLTMLCT